MNNLVDFQIKIFLAFFICMAVNMSYVFIYKLLIDILKLITVQVYQKI